MEPRYLLDTNICIYIRQKRPEEVLRRFRKLRPGEAVLSVITYGELLYGAAKSEQRVRAIEQLHELVSVLPALSLPEAAAEAYGTIRASAALSCRLMVWHPSCQLLLVFERRNVRMRDPMAAATLEPTLTPEELLR
jgi:tRNA(fMet)-specific endonuclease VapC